jgi:glycosyltransferase involved in cell wall biosynthesis
MDLICAVDLDTIIPCFFISLLRNKKRVYDAHELFCEMKEVVSRPSIHSFWKFVERRTLPKFKNGYTVNHSISSIYNKEYRVHYQVIRNVPYLVETTLQSEKERFIIYQGAVNEGRSFETLIPAFKYIDYPLFVYGDGNFFDKAVELVNRYGLQDKVIFKGKLLPSELKKITPKALLGVALVENNGLNSYYSLANRFFDYIHACVPQVCVNYPEYSYINQQYKVAMLIDDLSPESIATAVNSLIRDTQLYETMTRNCQAARQVYNWQKEEVKLIDFYKSIIPID